MSNKNTEQFSLSEIREVAENTFEVSFDIKGRDFVFEAGQYVRIEIPYDLYDDYFGNNRFFSVLSSPNDKDNIKIAFRMSDSSFKETLVRMHSGSLVGISSPLGAFVLPEKNDKDVLFIAGGIGITPFLSMIRYATENKSKQNITLVYSNRDEKNSAYLEELKNLEKQNNKFNLKNNFGKLDQSALKELLSGMDLKNTVCYVAGPPKMVSSVKDNLLDLSVPEENLKTEEFSGYSKKEKIKLERKTLEKLDNLLKDAKKLSSIFENSFDGILITDTSGIIRYVNPSWEKLTGWKSEEVVAKVTPRILKSGLKDSEFYNELWESILKGDSFRSDLINKKKNGELYDTDEIMIPFKDEKGEIIGFAGFQRDITEHKKVEKMKDEFVSVASHQLRTPMTTIKLFIELLLGEGFDKLTDSQKKYIETIGESTEKMINLINDLLDTSRLESNKIVSRKEDVDLYEFLDDIISDTKLLISAKKCNISLKKPDRESIKIFTDPNLLRQVFRNILDNSMKYSKENICDIGMSLEISDKKFLVKIEDNGIGMSEKDKERVFDRFFRAEEAVRLSSEGSGLGLYVSKNIVNILGGKIWFESKKEEGTTFFVELPIR